MAKTQFGADENALVSPFSLADGLSMLHARARGKTAQQIKEDLLQLTDWKDDKMYGEIGNTLREVKVMVQNNRFYCGPIPTLDAQFLELLYAVLNI